MEDYKLYTYVPQSGEVGISQMEGSAAATEQITAFSDQEAGWTTCIKGGSDATMNLSSNSDSDLGNFLERP